MICFAPELHYPLTTLVGASVKRAQAMLPEDAGVPSAEASSAVAPRERLLFDFDGNFSRAMAPTRCAISASGWAREISRRVVNSNLPQQKFDDSKWRSLNLPHDWAVELPFVRDEEQQSHGYKPLGRRYPETSVGWYRRDIRYSGKKMPGGASAWSSMARFATRSCF